MSGFLCGRVFASLRFLAVPLLSSVVTVSFTFWGTARLLSKVAVASSTPRASVRILACPAALEEASGSSCTTPQRDLVAAIETGKQFQAAVHTADRGSVTVGRRQADTALGTVGEKSSPLLPLGALRPSALPPGPPRVHLGPDLPLAERGGRPVPGLALHGCSVFQRTCCP